MLRQLGTSSPMKTEWLFKSLNLRASIGGDIQIYLCSMKSVRLILGIVKAAIFTTSYVDINKRWGDPLERVPGKGLRHTWCSFFARSRQSRIICS